MKGWPGRGFRPSHSDSEGLRVDVGAAACARRLESLWEGRKPRLLFAAIAALALAACATTSRRIATSDERDARAAELDGRDHWSLTGRVAVSNGKDGGSGRITWQQQGDDYVIEIRAPVSKQTWRLTQRDGELVLEGARPEPVRGADAEALLEREVGWRLPIVEMRRWVRGVAAHHDARVALDDAGLPREIAERGWRVEYLAYDDGRTPPLPTRIAATRPPYKVRLAIAEWRTE